MTKSKVTIGGTGTYLPVVVTFVRPGGTVMDDGFELHQGEMGIVVAILEDRNLLLEVMTTPAGWRPGDVTASKPRLHEVVVERRDVRIAGITARDFDSGRSGDCRHAVDRTVPASDAIGTLRANVDNHRLTDLEFRDLVRRSMPHVERVV